MKKTSLMAVCIILMMTAQVKAQEPYREQSVFNDYLNPSQSESFMSIPGLNFSSSMGFSYYSAGDYGSGGLGYYMGHFSYKLGSSWTLHWDVGIQSSMTGPESMQNPTLIVPNFNLTYRPNKNFMLRFQYNQFAGPMDYLMRRR